jgi:hypothetical protein
MDLEKPLTTYPMGRTDGIWRVLRLARLSACEGTSHW